MPEQPSGTDDDTEEASDRYTGLWVAVEAGVDEDPRVVTLAKTLKVRATYVVGHIVLVWCGVARHRPTGDLVGIPDEALEAWAKWRGRTGRFATAFREQFVGDNGQLRAWDKHNGKFLLRGLQERKRKRLERERKRRGLSADGHGTVTGQSAVNPTQPNPTTQPPPVVAGERGREEGGQVVNLTAVKAVTLAFNDAMRTNPAIVAFNEIPASTGTATVTEWLASGYPLDLCIGTVREVAGSFKPKGKDRQIGSLAYFSNPIRDAFAGTREDRYQYLAGEARRGMDMADIEKYPDWPQHETRFRNQGKAATNGVR